MMYGSCNTRHGKQNFLSVWAIFLYLTLLTTQKINIFKKMKEKKNCGEIIILHLCTTNDDRMMYGSWDMEHKIQFFLAFSTIFFYPQTTWKIKILKKWKKKARDITIFHMSTMNDNHMMYGSWNMKWDRTFFSIILCKCTKNQDYMLYCSWDMVYEGCNHYFSIWAIFYLLTPQPPNPKKKQKKKKYKKKKI